MVFITLVGMASGLEKRLYVLRAAIEDLEFDPKMLLFRCPADPNHWLRQSRAEALSKVHPVVSLYRMQYWLLC